MGVTDVPPRLITLLSDFGTSDPYVGVMKAAVHRLAPQATCVDLTHQIPPQNIGTASFWLAKSQTYFDAGTVHLAVVDPGVGTRRRPVAFEWSGQYFVGPDNGIFTDLLTAGSAIPPTRVVELDRAKIPASRRGTTFDGRDLFAPAAALLASGAPLTAVGAEVPPDSLLTSPTIFSPRHPKVRAIDHYGNLLTDAPAPENPEARVCLLGQRLIWCDTYESAPASTAVALRGSWGTVEIAVNQGSAAELLGAEIGTPIDVS